ncbi:MAG: YlxR family protein, partial [Actinomycetota bacterium]|nr:YlxR family protein [Actinomycetota bacterium]
MSSTDRTGLRPRQPVRTCVGCRRTDSRSALLRVVAVVGEWGGNVSLVPDPRHRLPGRGAWLHLSTTCLEQAVRRKAFTRALRLQVGPDSTAVQKYLTTTRDRPTE